MNVRMVGIDHEKASLIQREIFAFTSMQANQAMKKVVEANEIKGCVIISTCNRTELWISEKEGFKTDLSDLLCSLKNVSPADYEGLFVNRENDEAFRHLFQTACGLKSQIWGEDQILTQIRKAIEQARTAKTADTVLEKLFQMAVTSAKKIKTEVKLASFDMSVANMAIERIKERYYSLEKLKCMVIGNGEMGKLIAEKLADCGADVTVTLRRYKSGIYVIPKGCCGIDYEKRYENLIDFDVVVSATSSPHYTLRCSDIPEKFRIDSKNRLLVDLAVPRDIDPQIGCFANVMLIDMDSLGAVKNINENNPSLSTALGIIDEYIEDFVKWHKLKAFLPKIKKIASTTSSKIRHNMKKEIEELCLEEKQKSLFEEKLVETAEKAVSGLLFGIKDSIDKELWDECFSNLEKTVR